MTTLDETAHAIGTLISKDAEESGYVFALVIMDASGSRLATNMGSTDKAKAGRLLTRHAEKSGARVIVPRGGKG